MPPDSSEIMNSSKPSSFTIASLMRTSSSIISGGSVVYSSSGSAMFWPRVSEPNSAPAWKRHAELALDALQLLLVGAA